MVKIIVESVRDPRWASEDHSLIDCIVKTNTLVHEAPFTASIHDTEPHGREIYERCVAGEFGPITPMLSRKSNPLAEVIDRPPGFERLERFLLQANQENARKSSRSVTIVWASLLDNLLNEMLERYASREKAAGRPLGKPPQTFSQRINLAFKKGLIGPEEAEKCHHIRRIRNQAAHNWELNLETKDILSSMRALHKADHSGALVFHEELEFLVQQVYSSSCAMLVMKFMNR